MLIEIRMQGSRKGKVLEKREKEKKNILEENDKIYTHLCALCT